VYPLQTLVEDHTVLAQIPLMGTTQIKVLDPLVASVQSAWGVQQELVPLVLVQQALAQQVLVLQVLAQQVLAQQGPQRALPGRRLGRNRVLPLLPEGWDTSLQE
jgi:hypothetical protein